MKTSVTIGIIGYNDIENLSLCLEALKNINTAGLVLEFIYVDDNSTDLSVEKFQQCTLPGAKRVIKNTHTKGRSYNRNILLQNSQFKWILFLNSNIVIQNNSFLIQLIKDLNKMTNPIAIMSKITYTCKEAIFEKYLNNKFRGANQYQHLQNMQFNHLLFSGCLINRSFFIQHNLLFPENFYGYGGEELVVANKLNSIQKNSIFVNQKAVCTRVNHPILSQHYLKLFDFGNNNFPLLPRFLQKKIIKKERFLLKTKLNVWSVKISTILFCAIYKYCVNFVPEAASRQIIRGIYLFAILNGLYSNTKSK